MDYETFVQAQDDRGASELLTPQQVKWDKEGKTIVGQFLTKHEVPSGMGDGTFTLYTFDTNAGRVQFAMGAGVDTSVGPQLKPGGVYRITYRGKEPTAKGFTVNVFDVEFFGMIGTNVVHGTQNT